MDSDHSRDVVSQLAHLLNIDDVQDDLAGFYNAFYGPIDHHNPVSTDSSLSGPPEPAYEAETPHKTLSPFTPSESRDLPVDIENGEVSESLYSTAFNSGPPIRPNASLTPLTPLNDLLDLNSQPTEVIDDGRDGSDQIYGAVREDTNEMDARLVTREMVHWHIEETLDGVAPIEGGSLFRPMNQYHHPDHPHFAHHSITASSSPENEDTIFYDDSGISLSPLETIVKPTRATKQSRQAKIQAAVEQLRKGRIVPLDFMMDLVDVDEDAYERHRVFMYDANGSWKLKAVLDNIMKDTREKTILLDWMKPHALEQVSEIVSSELEIRSSRVRATLSNLAPSDLRSWELDRDEIATLSTDTPCLFRIIRSAVTHATTEKNKNKDTVGVSLQSTA